jgi:hypothetical protein
VDSRRLTAEVAFWLAVAYAIVWMGAWLLYALVGMTLGTDPCSVPRCSDLVTLGNGLLLGFTFVWMGLAAFLWTRSGRGWRAAGFLVAFSLPLATWYIVAWTLIAPGYEAGFGSVDWGPWWFPLPAG